MLELINEIEERLNELKKKIVSKKPKELDIKCIPIFEQSYVNLSDGSDKDKLDRICSQITELGINIIPTPTDSMLVRSAIVASLGADGIQNWLSIRCLSKNYDEEQQIKKYLLLLAHRETNKMNFGTVINRYKAAIDKYNNNLNNTNS